MVHDSLHALPWSAAAVGLAVVIGSTCPAAEPPMQHLRDAGQRIEKAGEKLERVGERLRDDVRGVTAHKMVSPEQRAQMTDFVLASVLAIADAEQVQVAKLAKSHAKSDKVKAFAQTLIEDHQKAIQQLEQFGARPQLEAGGSLAASQRQLERETQQKEQHPPRAATQTASTDPPKLMPKGPYGLDFLSIHREIAKKGIHAAEQCWNQKDNSQAELGFVGSQMVIHQQLIDAAEVLQQRASPKLQSVIESQVATMREHLDHTKQLLDELLQKKHTEGSTGSDAGSSQQ